MTILSYGGRWLLAVGLVVGLSGCLREDASAPPRVAAPADRPVAAIPAPAPAAVAFTRVRTSQRLVALTFDCCQTAKPAGFDRAIVDLLRARGVPATFFLGGRWMEAHPEAVRLLAATPEFELANHSYLHPHMTKLTAAQCREELERPQTILSEMTGRRARFFRPPYGEWNPTVAATAAGAGMSTVTWDISTGDPDPHATVADLLGEVHQAKPGSVIIMHANGRGWKTAQALPRILDWLKSQGLRPVTLTDLVAAGEPVAAAPTRRRS
ncbi:MAG TPA: polysaccharide deacetylase family protein [Armatimonadota bacterium]|jgi:peptidoglycan/xylan/chitin deacetylase (PgdA/CDA1 family)